MRDIIACAGGRLLNGAPRSGVCFLFLGHCTVGALTKMPPKSRCRGRLDAASSPSDIYRESGRPVERQASKGNDCQRASVRRTDVIGTDGNARAETGTSCAGDPLGRSGAVDDFGTFCPVVNGSWSGRQTQNPRMEMHSGRCACCLLVRPFRRDCGTGGSLRAWAALRSFCRARQTPFGLARNLMAVAPGP